ncbi:uncharacterized protein G2W53_029333 [Senna tora]|uniref:Uncharacterized protein n=1 Tax=Senna tora TaxID=362788 RepID=A0A834T442_9FABA|nr:uncharacterized protein G2W53_029333 [Senna tora]
MLQRCFGHQVAETPLQDWCPCLFGHGHQTTGVSATWWPKHPCSDARVLSLTGHPDRAAELDHQIVPAYDLYGIPDVQPHAYMGGVMIGHDACGIVAKNKKVFAIDFLFVADAFLVVVCKVMCTMIYSHGSLVHGSMEGEQCETQDVLGSQPGKVALEVPSSSTPAWSAGRFGARVGRTGACSRCPSLQSTPCWTLAGGRSWGTQDPLTAIYIRTRRKQPGGRTVCS